MIERCRLDDAHGLPDAARAAFARDGVLVIDDFASAAACEALRERALRLVAEHAPQAPGTVFSTRDQRHAKDAYFEASANRIGAFQQPSVESIPTLTSNPFMQSLDQCISIAQEPSPPRK